MHALLVCRVGSCSTKASTIHFIAIVQKMRSSSTSTAAARCPDDGQQRHNQPWWWRRRRQPRRRCPIGIVLLLLAAVATSLSSLIAVVYQWNQSYVDESLEAPLDHFQSTLWKPFYHLVGCPDMNITIASSTTTTTKNDGSVVRDIMDTIPMIMISARPDHIVAPVLQTWTDANFRLQLFNTTTLSRAAYHNDTRCHGRVVRNQGEGGATSFKSRLFGIYQRVLEQYENNYDYIVTVEDDVRLVDGDGLRHELRLAVERYHFEYYSFTKNHPDPDDADNHYSKITLRISSGCLYIDNELS